MADRVQCTAHITIKFDQEVPEDKELTFDSIKELEGLMKRDLLKNIRDHIVSEEDEAEGDIENLKLLVHVDIAVKEEDN